MEKTPTKSKRPKKNVELTPRSKLANEIAQLAVRRSSRRSAAAATANMTVQAEYKPESSDDDDDEGKILRFLKDISVSRTSSNGTYRYEK